MTTGNSKRLTIVCLVLPLAAIFLYSLLNKEIDIMGKFVGCGLSGAAIVMLISTYRKIN